MKILCLIFFAGFKKFLVFKSFVKEMEILCILSILIMLLLFSETLADIQLYFKAFSELQFLVMMIIFKGLPINQFSQIFLLFQEFFPCSSGIRLNHHDHFFSFNQSFLTSCDLKRTVILLLELSSSPTYLTLTSSLLKWH